MPLNVALVVAAGRGERLGADTPKQYLPLAGVAMLRHSLESFLSHPDIGAVAAVIAENDRAAYDQASFGLSLLPPVVGGATRQDSVRRGLEALQGIAPERVLIHDAARPFVDHGIISRVLDALHGAPAAIAAVPVADTLKRGDAGKISETVERSNLWRAQTPQGFHYRAILEAHRSAANETAEATDDAMVAERSGLPVVLVMGSENNFKVTNADDLKRAERFAGGSGEIRTGLGFDAHRFAPGNHLWLCGIEIPFGRTLSGHSDADVGLHAATDAILGAIGAGDIGIHFPPGDEKWRGAPSHQFLRFAAGRVSALGGAIVNLDVTLICEEPRIGPYRPAMIARIAEILGVPSARVSVKATTTEGMGFTGRGDGIAAQAVAAVRLPSAR
jgi:2-C-methyl-D-erythritol 4-phosphate cytidylyltransferase/2-C-methyl-D-erythritol 2,4-cyclodiphosphate synthase